MLTLAITSTILYLIILIFHVTSITAGTHIGPNGHRNAILQGIFCIAESILLVIFCYARLFGETPSNSKLLLFMGLLIAIVLLICGIINLTAATKENSDRLITETLSNVRITPAGYHNMARKIEGTVNGENRWFMIRGADKKIADDIKARGITQVTITYHPSNRRIEQISM